MVIRIIEVFVKQENVEEFIEATVKNHNGSLTEPGILRFDVLQDAADLTHFTLYEVYDSEAATKEHKETPHYEEWKNAVESMMAKSRQSRSYSAVAPLERAKWQS